jgi:hypothetical protein
MTNNKMKFGIAMVLISPFSVGLLTIPSKVAIAQTSPENQTGQPRGLICATMKYRVTSRR